MATGDRQERRFGGPTAAETAGAVLRARGMWVDPGKLERLERDLEFDKRQAARNRQAAVERVGDAARAVRGARREVELAMFDLRRKSSPETRAAAAEAIAARDAAMDVLRELCQHDDKLVAAVLARR
jgi:hypothetical protein